MSDNIHFLMISTGYVESQSVGVLLVRHVDGFATGEEALKDFSRVVKIIVEQGRKWARGYALKDCCKTQVGVEYCPKCGTRIKPEEADHQDLMNYVEGLMPGSLDSLGEGWETFDEEGWEVPAQMVPGRMVIVNHFHPVIEGVEDEEWSEHYYNEFSYSDIGMGKPVMPARSTTEVAPGVHQVTSSGSVFALPNANDVEEEEDGDFDPSISCKNSDYIFALMLYQDSTPWKYMASITPEAEWIKNGYMYDQHLPIRPRGWACLMEGVYESNMTDPVKMHTDLTAQGFRWDAKFTQFLKGLGNTVWIAPVGAPVTTPNASFTIGGHVCSQIPAQPSKIGTDECKKFITDLILGNPGFVAKEFSPVDPAAEQLSVNPKNWSRTGKRKEGKNSIRDFDCKPLDDQLRAYVTDDGTKIIGVEIQGE